MRQLNFEQYLKEKDESKKNNYLQKSNVAPGKAKSNEVKDVNNATDKESKPVQKASDSTKNVSNRSSDRNSTKRKSNTDDNEPEKKVKKEKPMSSQPDKKSEKVSNTINKSEEEKNEAMDVAEKNKVEENDRMLNEQTDTFLRDELKHCLGGKADGSNKNGDQLNKKYEEEFNKRFTDGSNAEIGKRIEKINNRMEQAAKDWKNEMVKLEPKLKEIEDFKNKISTQKSNLQIKLFNKIMKELCRIYWNDLRDNVTAGTKLEYKFTTLSENLSNILDDFVCKPTPFMQDVKK